MRNSEVVAKEIAILNEIKPKVRRYTFFGDDSHEAIDAQILVLRNLWDEDDVYETYGSDSDDESDGVLDAALSAVEWLNMETDDVPSEDWMLLIPGAED